MPMYVHREYSTHGYDENTIFINNLPQNNIYLRTEI